MTEELAINGGKPVREKKIFIVEPYLGKEEVEAASECIRTTWISSNGPKGKAAEKMLAEYLGVKHVVLVSNCTAALHLAMMTLELKEGEVIVPDYTFTSTGLAPTLCGCKPKLSEVEFDTANIDVTKIEENITPETKAIIPVHYAGHPADMDAINEIAKKHNLIVIEDAAQAIGSEYKGKKAGTLSKVGCFSFHTVKNITCSEGGALVTNDDEIAKKARMMRDKGTNKDDFNQSGTVGFYEYISTGHNFMLSDILAAILLEQLKKVDKINEMRAKNADYLTEGLKKLEKIKLPVVKPYAKTNWHLYTIRVPEGKVDFFVKAMNAEGINANIHYPPLHMNKFYQQYGYKKGDFLVSEKVFDSLVRLPLYPHLTQEELDDIIKAVKKVHEHL
jgi:perosamine synthetase